MYFTHRIEANCRINLANNDKLRLESDAAKDYLKQVTE